MAVLSLAVRFLLWQYGGGGGRGGADDSVVLTGLCVERRWSQGMSRSESERQDGGDTKDMNVLSIRK